jgi:hypothetical protein
MKTVVGILNSRVEATLAVERLRAIGLEKGLINLLTPDAKLAQLVDVKTTETEQPGSGPAIGGVVGGALGAAGGMGAGTAVASLVLPGVGSVLAVGLAAAAILGAAGAVGGAVAGEVLEDSMARGLPIDELFVYEDALRRGRTIVIAFPLDDDQAKRAREIMREVGAESVDAARDKWWVGLRDNDQAVYSQKRNDYKERETIYRRGLETALHPALGRRPYAEAVDSLRAVYPEEYADESFRRGYRRGYTYFRELLADRQR